MVTVFLCLKLKTTWKSVVFTKKVGENSRCFLGVFNKTIIPLLLVGYEIILANSALRATLATTTSYPTRTREVRRFLFIAKKHFITGSLQWYFPVSTWRIFYRVEKKKSLLVCEILRLWNISLQGSAVKLHFFSYSPILFSDLYYYDIIL